MSSAPGRTHSLAAAAPGDRLRRPVVRGRSRAGRRSTLRAVSALGLLAGVLLSFSRTAHSQSTAPAAPSSAPPAPADRPWLEAEGLGLRFRPPTEAFAKSETVDGVLRYEVVDALPHPRWWLRFQALTSSRAGLTAADQIAAYLDTLRKNDKEFAVRVDEAVTPRGASGEGRLLVIESPIGDGATGLSGWFIVPNGSDRFLTCSIVAPSSEVGSTIPLLRDAFASIELTSAESLIAARKDRMDRGARMLSFSKRDLRDALHAEPVLYRVFRPASASSDEVEVGWMSVRAVEGRRGEVDPSRDPKSFRGDDVEAGLLVVIDAKSIVNGDPRHTVDSQIRYWLGWERQTEMWSLRSTERQGAASRSSAQTGVRSHPRPGDARPLLRVINSISERQTRDPLEWAVPPNYLSQAELVLLGRLLPKDDPAPEPFASYAFDPKSSGLPQRLDTWRRLDDGTWSLETKIGGTSTPLMQTFAADGTRLRRIDVDALGTVVTERIEGNALRALWKRKGLPIE